mgnify:CR=1 FL=1
MRDKAIPPPHPFHFRLLYSTCTHQCICIILHQCNESENNSKEKIAIQDILIPQKESKLLNTVKIVMALLQW